jgi:hypothetical protein
VWSSLVVFHHSFKGLENRDYGRGDPLRCPRDTLYQPKLALTLPTGCRRSVGIVRLRTKTTEFSLSLFQSMFPFEVIKSGSAGEISVNCFEKSRYLSIYSLFNDAVSSSVSVCRVTGSLVRN